SGPRSGLRETRTPDAEASDTASVPRAAAPSGARAPSRRAMPAPAPERSRRRTRRTAHPTRARSRGGRREPTAWHAARRGGRRRSWDLVQPDGAADAGDGAVGVKPPVRVLVAAVDLWPEIELAPLADRIGKAINPAAPEAHFTDRDPAVRTLVR